MRDRKADTDMVLAALRKVRPKGVSVDDLACQCAMSIEEVELALLCSSRARQDAKTLRWRYYSRTEARREPEWVRDARERMRALTFIREHQREEEQRLREELTYYQRRKAE